MHALRTSAITILLATLCTLLLVVPMRGQQPQDREKADVTEASRRKFEANARQLTFFDRAGKTLSTLGDRAIYTEPVFSPDGTRLAVTKVDLSVDRCPTPAQCPADIWVFDLTTGKETRVTSSLGLDRVVQASVWSPDGRELVYCAVRGFSAALYRKAASGEGSEELLYRNAGGTPMVPLNWTPDGRLSFWSSGIWQMVVTGDGKP